MREPRYAIDEAGATPLRTAWRYVPCISDAERPLCLATVRQERQPDGSWLTASGSRWPFCADCDAAFAAREARKQRSLGEAA